MAPRTDDLSMNYLITPPNTHYDGGLGITACNFSRASDILKKHNNSMDGILPLCYLQRHAIELFLKSLIVILHRKFQVPYGPGFSFEKPAIQVQKKWVPLSNTHNILDLYQHFTSIYTGLIGKLPATTCWDLPNDIERKIKLISGSDPKSTYFRYPESTNSVQDSKKSGIQKESLESMISKSKYSGTAFKCVLMLDQNDDVIDSYNIKSYPLPNTLTALEELNDFFNGMHAAFRFELTNCS